MTVRGRSSHALRTAAALLFGAAVCAALAQQAAPAASRAASPAASAPSAAANAALPAEAFFRHPEVLRAELSPSGKRLAITTSAGSQRVGLAVFELGESVSARRAALFSDADIVRFQWVDDERLVFSVLDLESGSAADRSEAPGLYAVNADGSDLRQLVARRWLAAVEPRGARVQALRWNHRLLHVPAPLPGNPTDEVIVGTLVYGAGNELRHINPQWLNVRTGRTRFMDLKLPGDVVAWWFDSAGEARAAATRSGGHRSIHWRAPGGSDWVQLSEAHTLQQPFAPYAVDDAGQLYVTHPHGPEGLTVLSRYDFERRAPAAEPWVKVAGFDFRGDLIRSGAGPVLGVRTEADAGTTGWFDERMQAMQVLADQRLPGRVNRLSCRRCGQADGVVLVQSSSDRDPGQLWLYRAAGAQWLAVSRVMPGIDPAQMATVELHRIKARDGRELPVWLTLPPGHRPGAPPRSAVVVVHGGPWVRGGFWRWQAMEQFLASRGHVVISPDFRGSQGYGEAHFKAGWKQWGRAMQDDVADALLWARSQGLADRACIAGASYGGYSTLMGLVRHPELYRCGVAWVAVTDPLLYLEGSFWINDDISDSGRRYQLPEMVGDVQADADMLTAVSPLAQAARIRAPLLLGFGESDLRVPLAHGTRLREALRAAGREPEWVSYPGEGHSWRQVATRTDWARRVEQFLSRHLAEPPR